MKYNGRQQYGVFLKAIGFPLEESLAFWKKSFAPRTTDAEFAKSYAYNIRHHYGLEGKRISHTPQSCSKIIGTSNAASTNTDDTFGCPFKNLSQDALRASLANHSSTSNSSLNLEQVDEIVDLASRSHYQMACTRYFEHSRAQSIQKAISAGKLSGSAIDTITHPHLYLESGLTLADIEDLK